MLSANATIRAGLALVRLYVNDPGTTFRIGSAGLPSRCVISIRSTRLSDEAVTISSGPY